MMNLTIICRFFVFVCASKEIVASNNLHLQNILHQLQWENDLFVSRDIVRDKN